MAASVVQSGSYLLELDTGFDYNSFRLDDATKGVLNNTTYTLGPNTTYADITEYVTEVAYRRGRRNIDDQFGAGTMSFRMTDETGILGPYDTASPYYDPANDKPGLAPMRRVRLSRASEYLFVGYVIAYNYEFALAGPNAVQVTCADDFYLLSQTQLAAFNPSAETSGQRITTVLALPEVNYTGSTNIDTGTVNMGHDSSYNVAAGTNTLGYITQINQAEQGRVFMSRAGVLTFQPRIGATLSSPVIVFSDQGTNTKYDEVEIEFDADGVLNRAYVQALDGKNATAEDLTSQATYFIQSQSITNSLLHDQGEIDDLAAYLLEPEPAPRYTAVSTNFALLTDVERGLAATVDIGDTITITKDVTGIASLTSELSVEGIEGRINFASGHRITYYTAPTTVVYQLILNDPVYGQLDSTNVLGDPTPPPPPPVIVDDEMITVGFDVSSTIADATTYYFGTVFDALTSTAQRRKIYFSQAGTITSADIFTYAVTAGAADAWSLNIRKNDTTDYLVATLSVATNERRFVNASMSVPIAVNDYIELTLGPTTWPTNPSSLAGGGLLKFVPA
jgi:hypothetical protein